jgi:hypothetical protein
MKVWMQKCISLLSIAQSQPTHTPSTRNHATGFSFKEPFFLHDEGPHSRCYGRTTALRLFVQPYDEN